jgi:hypothetical protein
MPQQPLKIGDHLVYCDMCNSKRLRSQCRKTWQGFIVCNPECFEVRHPQSYMVHPKGDKMGVPDPRPGGPDVFIDTTQPPNWTQPEAGTANNTVQPREQNQ